jgi:leucyl aminopeptidase (aminopeptidase T)
MEQNDYTTEAAEKILHQCLALPTNADIVVFADETTIDTARVLTETALHLDLQPIMTYFSVQMQEFLGGRELPASLDTILKDSVAALICLNSSPRCLPFRDNVRKSAWNHGCKVAHMPGISKDTLLLANVDYQILSEQCEMLALALVKGHQIEIISEDHLGKQYRLVSSLQPWRRFPIISDGVIQKGSWGNVPSGETYIAPLEGTAEGQIVIDGSVPGYVIQPGEEIVLHFHHGNLTHWTPSDSPVIQHLVKTQFEYAKTKGDQRWVNLGEIGIGANPRVHSLTGNPLLDEKKYGSLHIALGDNQDMGGEVSSDIHCDMVCLRPKVLIDDKVILRDGRIVMVAKDWQDDYHSVQPPEHWNGDLKISRTATNFHIDWRGRLKRVWDTSAGRVCSVYVGDDETALKAATVYQKISQGGQRLSIQDLSYQIPPFDLYQLMQLSFLLSLYGLVTINNHNIE